MIVQNRKSTLEKNRELTLRLSQRFLRRTISRRDNGGQDEPLFLASRPPCRSLGAGCNCDPCLRLATGERACLCVGGCDDGCCCGHSHTGAFSFSRHGLIACRAKPSPTQPPEQPACARMVRSCRRHARLDASPERPCVPLSGHSFSGRAADHDRGDGRQKTDKTASPMPNGGMAEAGSNRLHWSTGERRRLSLNPKKRGCTRLLEQCGLPSERGLQWITA